MSVDSTPFTPQDEPDALLTRLQDNYTRQKRLVAAQKRKQADIELQAAAAYYSDLPVTLELLSDQTASLFTELEHLIQPQQESKAASSKEVLLLQRIRAAVNRELRQSMSFIEEGYQSGFEKLMRQGRVEERQDLSLLTTAPKATPAASPALSSSGGNAVSSPTCGLAPAALPAKPLRKTELSVQEALSEHVSLVAESLAVLLKCETVRVYLYDQYENLRCAAQFPYRACRADPSRSSSLALMTVREVHQTVCRDHLAVNGTVPTLISVAPTPSQRSPGSGSTITPATPPSSQTPTGVEDIRSCLIFPLLCASGTGKSYGMIHAVNKRFPGPVEMEGRSSTELPLRGFSLEDEVLVCNAARLLGTTLSRYPAEAFTNIGIGEAIRRRAYPGDAQVGSLTAHLPPALHDDVEEAAEVGQDILNRTLPTLVYRAPVNAIFAARGAPAVRRRSLGSLGGDHDASVSTVAFRLRCMNELWASSRDDNSTLHQLYRALEEEAQQTRVLLRNVLDGVATARSMRVSADVAQYLQTLEVYGRSARTERMAAYVADKMLTLTQQRKGGDEAETQEGGNALPLLDTTAPAIEPSREAESYAMSTKELRRLQHDHARLNTVTVSSLHYDGPGGVPSYTSAPAQKREQVRFIDELRRSGTGEAAATATPPPHNLLPRLARANNHNGSSSHNGTSRQTHQKDPYPFQRPFKL